MTGWKTKAAGYGAILSGVGMIITAFVTGEYGSIEGGIALIAGGLATLGIGHKIEKSSN